MDDDRKGSSHLPPLTGLVDAQKSTEIPPNKLATNKQSSETPLDDRMDHEDESYRDKLMSDTYEFALPMVEANAIAKEMDIKVTYGLKILTGEERFLEQEGDILSNEEYYSRYQESLNNLDNSDPSQIFPNNETRPGSARFNTVVTRSIKPETLDIPPELYIQVKLEEFDMVFYWTKEKFQERRIKMLELFGAWDVGGKPGLVEYLIEQSNYQGFYMVDPFIDNPLTNFVLIGHVQINLEPITHKSDLHQEFDIISVDDDIVGSLKIKAIPCHPEAIDDPLKPYKCMTENELSKVLLDDPQELIGKRFVFLLKICTCDRVPSRYQKVFCQYSLDRNMSPIRTMIHRDETSGEQQGRQVEPEANSKSFKEDSIDFNHNNYIVIDRMNQDILDFLNQGFLAIQLVGQYKLDQTKENEASSWNSSATNSTNSTPSYPTSLASTTVVSTIISSINKYKYRIEQQSSSSGVSNSANYSKNMFGVRDDSATNRIIDSGVLKSNSGTSSVTSTLASVSLYDHQNDDEDGTMNGLSQENIIDMILTKRKLDRAENQLHYLKRTINIAEHYNKKHIPVKTVKKLLNSYGHELERGSLEELTSDVTAEGKSSSNKHTGCNLM